MNGIAVHYWVWHSEIWQQLEDSERGWHAADGSSRRTDHRGNQTGGNLDTIAIEAIGSDAETEETLAALVAYLCKTHGLDPSYDVYTHNYWLYGTDSIVPGASKNCPIYILPHWDSFLGEVKSIFGSSTPVQPAQPSNSSLLAVGTVVSYAGEVHYISSTADSPSECKGGKAKITSVAPNAKHPYHPLS